MKKVKPIFLIIAVPVASVLAFLAFILIVILLLPHPMSKDSIIDIVNNEPELLTQAIQEDGNDPDGQLAKLGVQIIWYRYPGEYCEFCCGNGIDDYSGFYYSADDVPYGWEGDDTALQEDGEGRWIYQDDDHYFSYITERIRENWFYFYAHT